MAIHPRLADVQDDEDLQQASALWQILQDGQVERQQGLFSPASQVFAEIEAMDKANEE